MRKKRFIIGLLVGCLTFVMIGSTAFAGNVQRNRWEGVAIGVAATLLGQALLDNHRASYYQPAPAPKAVPPQHGYRSPAYGRGYHKAANHRSFQKVWVPPVYKRVWNPGHYNPGGHWIQGHWIEKQIAPGYWTKQPVWSARERGPHGHPRP